MLETLHIENIAVIERTDISFANGLNVLTGETGAGKSIVIDALDAVLGGRVSRTLVRTGADRAVVSAVFSSDTGQAWCDENDMDLTEDQKAVVMLDAGRHLVLAPPGSGKTELLSQRILRAVRAGVEPGKMLCVA